MELSEALRAYLSLERATSLIEEFDGSMADDTREILERLWESLSDAEQEVLKNRDREVLELEDGDPEEDL